jgi:hypothetical protein
MPAHLKAALEAKKAKSHIVGSAPMKMDDEEKMPKQKHLAASLAKKCMK